MRTTVELDRDTAQAVQALRKQGRGVSEAVNELIRRGMMAPRQEKPFVARPRRLGVRIDISNIADAVDLLEGPQAR
ncbi:MAG TPA: CopG family transcriptional regulator [Propionibacteriaceae bacterium]|jgi:hypothetical protein|nr:CopG family transcriptional regulator [Propionibacteriaceae bacterium]